MSTELHPELQSSLERTRMGLTFVRHPLIGGIYMPEMAGMLNRALEGKQRAVAEALQREDYEAYVWLHERPYRAGAYARIETRMPLESSRLLLRAVWTDAEMPGVNRSFFLKRFRALRQVEAYKEVEKAVGGETFKLYRGTRRVERTLGLSWTTEREKAVWFARRFARGRDIPMLYTLEYVHWNAILAYIDDRGESEVIVDTSWPNIRRSLSSENVS